MWLIDADKIHFNCAITTPLEMDYVRRYAIDKMPTVDAVPVVRCKDCKHCFVDGDNVRFNVCELNHNRVQADDWFCADGERKGGDE